MNTAEDNPTTRFSRVFEEARKADPAGYDAVCLSTASAEGRPSARMVLLKGHDERGFVFYTNLGSRKARELSRNPYAALTFHWPALEQQVRVEGRAVPVSDAEADTYFASRPRGSQIGAWASRQSDALPSRALLEQAIREVEVRYEGAAVPRPEFWSGFRIEPDVIEFWTGMPSRLHQRIRYVRHNGVWTSEALYP